MKGKGKFWRWVWRKLMDNGLLWEQLNANGIYINPLLYAIKLTDKIDYLVPWERICSCQKCRHLLLKENAQAVKVHVEEDQDYSFHFYYCPKHHVKYDRILRETHTDIHQKYFKNTIPEIEVDEKGRLVKSNTQPLATRP